MKNKKYTTFGLEERTKDFFSRAIAKWGDKNDYTDSVFTKMSNKIDIRCVKHDLVYTQIARVHLQNNGCPECYREAYALTLEEFIRRARLIHGDKYDYSLVEFKRSTDKVKIICPIHGVFEQRVANHLNGQSCLQCFNDSRRKSKRPVVEDPDNKLRDIFIEKAIAKYGNLYDYSKVVYTGSYNKVTIICPIHGEFRVTPHHHLNNSKGCKKCVNNSPKRRQEFIEKAIEIHGDIHGYEKLDMNDKYITIYCKVHDIEYQQEKRNHLQYSGCKQCIQEKQHLGLDKFIELSNLKYDNFFTHEKSVYVTNDTPIIITCPEHGDFSKRPYEHLRRNGGCPICNSSKMEQVLYNYFKNLSIPITKEKMFKDYRYRYDFYLNNNNILIEYHGMQHYKPIIHWGGLSGLVQIKQNDALKEKLAKELGVPLIILSSLNEDGLISELETTLKKYFKYLKDGVYFNTLEELCNHFKLDSTDQEDYNKYLLQ